MKCLISGGGWTTSLAAALDSRIMKSVTVAGSVPQYIAYDSCGNSVEQGDWEVQSLRSVVDALDLNIMSGIGAYRKQLQVFNQFDNCCYFGVRSKSFSENPTFNSIKFMIPSQLETLVDSQFPPGESTHTISPTVLNGPISFLFGINVAVPTVAVTPQVSPMPSRRPIVLHTPLGPVQNSQR